MKKLKYYIRTNLLVFSVFCIVFGKGHAQLAGVVSAPVLEAHTLSGNVIMASVLTGIELSNDALDDIERIRKSAGFLGDLQAITDLIVVMESYACLAQGFNADLEFVDGLVGPYNSCLFDFNYSTNFVKLQFAQDLLNKILTDGFSMEPGERMKAVGDVIARYDTTMRQLSKQRMRVRCIIRKYEMEIGYSSSIDDLWDMAYKRKSSGGFF